MYPDKRKGLVYLYQGNDMLMHFCWKDRLSNTPEDDLVIFPDEIEFKKVTQNTTGKNNRTEKVEIFMYFVFRTCLYSQMEKQCP